MRYATAVFELSKEDNALATLEKDVETIDSALAESADLRDLIASPVYSRADQTRAVAALGDRMGLSRNVTGTLGLMASKRRLFALPQMLAALRRLIAEEKGEVTAEVTAARALDAGQKAALAETLKGRIGKDVKLKLAVDETLIGGLVVKVGSRMIDTSIRSKLAALQNSMKEVG